jgi:hypothetical protein
MSKEKRNNHKLTDSEEVKTNEKELFRQQMDEWLKIYLDDCFSSLIEQELIETDKSEEPLGE